MSRTTKKVTRVIEIEGPPDWVDLVIGKSLLKEQGEPGVKILAPDCFIRCTSFKSEVTTGKVRAE